LTVTLESIGDGVITTDTVGNIVLLNKVAEQLTGWSAATAVGQPLMTVLRLVDEKTRVPRDNPVATALQNAEIVNRPQHSLLLAQDQNERLIADTIAPIRNQGQVIGAVLVFRDMTERRKFEEELTKADKLESISVLAGGLAHDFNNILTAILGNLSLAKMYADPEDKVFGRLLSAEKAAQQAQNLTRQLLTFSKGGLLVRTPSSIVDIVKDSIDLSLRGSNVKCDLLVQTDVWPVEVDTGQIVQVINNLIINADQAMPDGGRMEVRLENVEIHEEHHNILLPLQVGKYIKISFTDNGIGIPEDIMQKIFDPYFTTKKKGSGLGLFSCYSIIKKHDGHIAVESTPGVGTTFYVYLPASLQEVIAVQDRSEVRSVGTGYILIMEDEETIREVTGEMLSHFGYEVEFAPDGAAAIELYQRAKETGKAFDVVIMDLTIPGGMGGKEAVRHLLALDPQARVVVASGYANDPILTDFQHYGFCERIAKPYKAEELHVLLHRIITGTSP
jgi:PAS domain S-box-containing protein